MFFLFIRPRRIADTFATSAARKFLYRTVASGLVKISAILYSVLTYKITLSESQLVESSFLLAIARVQVLMYATNLHITYTRYNANLTNSFADMIQAVHM